MTPPTGPGPRARLVAFLGVWLVALAWLSADLASKAWALEALAAGEREVLSGVLWFNLTRNPGAAFGLFPGGRPFFVAVTAVLIGVGAVAPFLFETRSLGSGHVGLGLLVGGGMGNLYDRVFRDGLVVDFIDVRIWPVFNLADVGIVTGTGLVLLYLVTRVLRPGVGSG